ncbi:cholesterol esterase [Savitreella phatthalungensis]
MFFSGEHLMVTFSLALVLLEMILHAATWLLPTPIYRLFYGISKRLIRKPRSVSNGEASMVDTIRTATDFVDMCAVFGYEAEEHVVRTSDDYLLCVHRLCKTRDELIRRGASDSASLTSTRGKRTPRTNKPVIYMHHGLMMNSEVWIANVDHNRQLPLLLVEAGYDVWLGNNRGNKYSKKHIRSRNAADRDFWNFSMDDFALSDIPDTIDYIIHATGVESLSYVGFSQGSAQAFATLSINPRLNDKINLFIALAPAMSPQDNGVSIANTIVKSSPALLFLLFGRKTILPSAMFWQSVIYPPAYVRLLDYCMKLLFGWHSTNMSPQQKLASYYHLYSSTSVKVLVHWFQIIRAGRFQMYDDHVHHHSATSFYKPARFPTRNIATPIVLMYGGADSLVDIDVMLSNLPENTIAEEIAHYEHLDFLWAADTDRIVIPRVMHYLRQLTDTWPGGDLYSEGETLVGKERLSRIASDVSLSATSDVNSSTTRADSLSPPNAKRKSRSTAERYIKTHAAVKAGPVAGITSDAVKIKPEL